MWRACVLMQCNYQKFSECPAHFAVMYRLQAYQNGWKCGFIYFCTFSSQRLFIVMLFYHSIIIVKSRVENACLLMNTADSIDMKISSKMFEKGNKWKDREIESIECGITRHHFILGSIRITAKEEKMFGSNL